MGVGVGVGVGECSKKNEEIILGVCLNFKNIIVDK